jgi:AraC-like DNA-binding protein/ketosteroid isomerase-like protein
VVRRYHLAWQARDLEAILALYHPDVAYHDFLQNRVFGHAELRDYVSAALPRGASDLLEHSDRIRVDGDTAFIQYRLLLSGHDGQVSFCSSEAIQVRDGLIWQIREYAVLQTQRSTPDSKTDARSPLQRLGLSARQLSRLAADLEGYFQQQRPFLQPDCSLASVAVATGYSRNQLSYLLNQVLKLSFYRYVNQARIRYLLQSWPPAGGSGRIDELAFAAGFNSLSAFYRCFRQHTGLSPTRYLQDLASGHASTTAPGRAD